MTSLSLNQLLVIYTWFPMTVLVLFMFLIGRFYQKFSNEQTHFRFFLLPLALFGLAAVRYASLDDFITDPFADIFIAIGGFVLAFLSFRLYWLMTIKNRDER